MPAPYDMAFRGRAVAAYEAGEGGYHELAALFRVGYRTLQRWVTQYRATDSVAPQRPGGGWRSPIAIVVLHGVVRKRPDGTSEELCCEYNRRVGRAASTSPAGFRRAITRAGYVLKKHGGVRVNATDPTFSSAARRFSGRSTASIRGDSSRSMRRA